MVLELRSEIMKRLDDNVLLSIKNAPKPTKVAEVIAVVKHFPGMALSLEEIAEIINIADPGRSTKAKPSDYNPMEIMKNKELVVISGPDGTYVRYTHSMR
ncbi:MAG: hypothetical protein QW097_00050 [archaeon]